MSVDGGSTAGCGSPPLATTGLGVAEDLAAPLDEYEDMEKWFSSSFPSAGAANTCAGDTITAQHGNLKSMAPGSWVAFGGRQDDGEHSPDAVEGMEINVDEYEIDLDPNGLSSSNDEQLSTSPVWDKSGCNWTDARQPADAETADQEEVEAAGPAQPKVFKRRQRGDLESLNGCDRCKSNSNGKLLVRCATCTFRRHLYCFSPPLKQHPAFQQLQHVTPQGKKVKVRPSADAIARWKCDDCQQKHFPNQASEDSWRDRRSRTPVTSANKPQRSTTAKVNHKDRQSSPKRQKPAPDILDGPTGSEDDLLNPVQAKWCRNGQSEFDWYAFRADKVERLRSQGDTNKPDELVYYSKPFADLKKTVSSWLERVAWQKSFRRQRELVEAKTQLPQKRNVMLTLTEKELKLIEASLLRRQKDAEEEMTLFDDAQAYEFDISVSRIRSLRQPRASVVVPTLFDEEENFGEIAQMLQEMTEIVALSAEDVDSSQPDENSITPTQVTRVAKLKWAAVVIQSAFIRWSCVAKQRLKIKSQQDLVVREHMQRQKAAAKSISFLRSCVRFIILLVRNLRNAQIKKQLLLTLQEASEDSKVAISAADDTEKVKKLAEKRIQRFFLRSVRRYIRLKKMVMSRRILRWWKHKFLRWQWRETAITTRERHRERASRVIQRAYKRFRAKKTFQELLEKHSLRKLKLFLRSWLMARVIKKERARVEIFTLATAIGVANEELTSRPDATVEQILFALGMGLYTSGDFWNAASVLERTWKLNRAAVTWEGRLALAYSHHMAWYSSYDALNLTQAYETYCAALNEFFQQRTTARDALAEIDPFILQDMAVVMMHMENFNGSLRMLARLIEFFAQHESLPLWLLLAAVQLQQRGEWAQSVEYLTYLQDMPPSPYLERDILCLCAIGLERQKQDPASRTAGREAWNAAIRQWSLAQKEIHVFEEEKDTTWSQPRDNMSRSRAAQSTLRKWDMLNEFAQRAATQGHYLLACRLMLYMVELHSGDDDEAPSDAERSQRASLWWNLADVFRHLGHLDLYVDATKRSHHCVETSDPPCSGDVDSKQVAQWIREAETQSHSFQSDCEKLVTLDFVRKVHAKYSQM
ncbi:hypothetical protein Gpo141_00003107 [Globisporangium polare]